MYKNVKLCEIFNKFHNFMILYFISLLHVQIKNLIKGGVKNEI